MELSEAKEVLMQISDSVASGQWDKELTMAIQRALAELYLLNPYDDVDGLIGKRTRSAWGLFKEVSKQSDPDTVDVASAALLMQAADQPIQFIGKVNVSLQPDFEFRRNKAQANRDTSAQAIISAAKAQGLSKAQIAYILASAEHESDSFKTLEEYSDGEYLNGRTDLGNTQDGDGPLFKGRGYVQLTGRNNYIKYSQITGIRLVSLPVILMNWPALSVFVIVDGMTRGVYTGLRLDEFVNNAKEDFFHARQVVNGLDRAQKIADQATDWLQVLS